MNNHHTHRSSISATLRLLLLAGGASTLLAPQAHAQDALGDGRALDNNLRVGSGGRNAPGRDFAREFSFRNAIVTGNVPGGFAFRGELGYTAADDFRGELGSNDNFDFMRDSFYSSLATRNLEGIDPLRSTLSWSIAGQRDNVFGDLIVARSGAGTDAGSVEAVPSHLPRVDVFATIDGTMRSASSFMLESEIRPLTLGYTQDEQTGEVGIVAASSLLGVRTLPPISPVFGQENVDDLDRLYQTDLPGTTDPTRPTTPDSDTGEDDESPELTNPNQITPDYATEPSENAQNISMYNRVVASLRAESNLASPVRAGTPEIRVGEQPIPTTPEDTATDEDPLDPSQLLPDDTDAPGEETGEFDQYERSIQRLREALRLEDLPVPRPAEEDEEDPNAQNIRDVSTMQLVDEMVRDLILPGMTRIESLDPPPDTSITFKRHIEAGQDHLREGEWFSAEERFTAALSIEPGDPGAAIGRVASQLAGGMYLSAALNLRDLLRAYPELLAVQFDESLLPDKERIERIRAQLRQRAETDRPLARDAGLLLAFLGHQTANPQDVRDGFAIIERVEKALDISPDPVHVAARAAWMIAPEVDTPYTPSEAPAP